jgi:P27 family predicted phage terminase small subunit
LGEPVVPGTLGAAGRELWARIAGDVPEGWRLDERELRALEAACRCADDVAELEAAVERDGFTVEGSQGQPRAHPALDLIVRLRGLEASLLRRLELEPPRVRSPVEARSARAAASRWSARRRQGAV